MYSSLNGGFPVSCMAKGPTGLKFNVMSLDDAVVGRRVSELGSTYRKQFAELLYLACTWKRSGALCLREKIMHRRERVLNETLLTLSNREMPT